MTARRTYRPWTTVEEATLRALWCDDHLTAREISEAMDRGVASIQNKLEALALRESNRAPKDESPTVGEWIAKRDAIAQAVQPQKPVIEIVDLPPVPVLPLKYKPSPCYVISSDHHWPLHDPKAEAIVLQAIEALKPRGYILNGDGADILALSKYPKDQRHGKSWRLNEEQMHAKNWWREVWLRGQQWGMALYETDANHSGSGAESRWVRYLNDRCPELFGLDGFEEVMRYERFFHPVDVPVQLVPEVVIANDLRVRHGEIVRKHGGYSARAHGDKWQASILHGHTHRSGSSVKRRPGIPGVRADEFLRTYETGCMCMLDADYCPGSDWAQGFAIVHVDDASGSYSVELVHIEHGRATSSALGGTLAA